MTDYIRREDALFALRKVERGGSMTALTRLERAYAEIREMPAADVAPVRHGRWIYHDDGVFTCSECGNAESNDSYYCRLCGAKMDGGEDRAVS